MPNVLITGCSSGFGNVTESRGFTEHHPGRPAFDRFHARMLAVGGDGRADPQPVVDAVLAAIDEPAGPFRRLVGQDAELVATLKRDRPFTELEAAMGAALGESA